MKKPKTDINGVLYFDGTCATDHLGNTYKSVAAMARAYGFPFHILDSRLRKGFPLERALTMGINEYRDNSHHWHPLTAGGRSFPSIKEACEYYGVKYDTYCHRRYRGKTVEEALQVPVEERTDGTGLVSDGMGGLFRSTTEMCEYHGITLSTYYQRMKKKLQPEKVFHKGYLSCVEAFGETFGTSKEMCKRYGISQRTYYRRLKHGMTKEEALTMPMWQRKEKTV